MMVAFIGATFATFFMAIVAFAVYEALEVAEDE